MVWYPACLCRNFGGANACHEGQIHRFDCSTGCWKKRIVFLWIGRLKGVLLEDSSFCFLTMWCFSSWSLQSRKDIFPKSIPSKVFYPGEHLFFWLSYHVMFCCCGHDKTQKKPKSTLSKVFCWRTYRIFVSKIAVNQWWLRKKINDAFFCFRNRNFKGIFHCVGPEL